MAKRIGVQKRFSSNKTKRHAITDVNFDRFANKSRMKIT